MSDNFVSGFSKVLSWLMGLAGFFAIMSNIFLNIIGRVASAITDAMGLEISFGVGGNVWNLFDNSVVGFINFVFPLPQFVALVLFLMSLRVAFLVSKLVIFIYRLMPFKFT